jgi:squalene-associated FAD-dependent desaturase
MPEVIVAGGGLAGMAAAVALAGAGCRVSLFESRGFLGGRAASLPASPSQETPEAIDNSQHILLRCCVNLLNFYERLGVADRIDFHREFRFIEPGGRISVLRAGHLPSPLHLAGSFSRLPFLDVRAKLAIARAMTAIRREYGRRRDLDEITMLDWLREKSQPPRAIARFWRPVLVSAVNAELEVMAARHGLQVFRLAFLARGDSYEMGVPAVLLSELYSAGAWGSLPRLEIRLRSPVDRILFDGPRVAGVVSGEMRHTADYYVCALPFERTREVAPELELDLTAFRHSPITAIHLWFDRPVTDLPHAALVDRTIQWLFSKAGGRYVQLVISASHALVEMSRTQVIELALRELAEFVPGAREAVLEKAHVIKELRATLSPVPGLEALRPASRTAYSNLFLAGDWTRSGWPSTMEGAVRSGYLAAEAVTQAAGQPRTFLLPDLA